jgi:hypothetical protein
LSWIQQASSHQSNPSHQSLHTKALNFYSTLLLQTSLASRNTKIVAACSVTTAFCAVRCSSE